MTPGGQIRAAAGATLAGALALVVATGFYYLLKVAGVGVPERSAAELEAMLTPYAELVTPQGDGPFPAIVLMHGCGGRQPMYDDYAALAAEAGVAALVVDSFTPRGIDRIEALSLVCTGALVMGRERAADLAVMLDWLKDRPEIDPERIAVAGWSHGGWTILDLMTMRLDRGDGPQGLADPPAHALEGVDAALLIYPFCRFPALARERRLVHPAAIEAIIGSADTVVGLQDCAAIFEREAEAGGDVAWSVWPGLTHSFDDPDQPDISPHNYDPAAAERAHQAFVDFLQRRLLGGAASPEPADEPAPPDADAPPADEPVAKTWAL